MDRKKLTIDHDLNSFTEGQDYIMTLKDSNVMADDGDCLENIDIQ